MNQSVPAMDRLSIASSTGRMPNSVQPKPTLVLGGTGKTGRRVVDRLTRLERPVRVGSRQGDPPFDWTDRSTWEPTLDGVASAYVSYYPDLTVPGAVDAIGAFARLAVARDVSRLVFLSGRGEHEAARAERAVVDAGAAVTIIRSTWFAQNFSEDYLLDDIRSGVVALPAGDTPEPFVDVDDIADIAVAALTDDRHIGQTYEVTGPQALSFAEAVAVIAAATGRDIRYVPVSTEEHAAASLAHGVPEEIVELLTYLFAEVLDGRNSHVTDGVHRALGRPPNDFTSYARAAATTGVWDVPVATEARR
jgi:uncharacterized protein YbjT (DUF2867 family)